MSRFHQWFCLRKNISWCTGEWMNCLDCLVQYKFHRRHTNHTNRFLIFIKKYKLITKFVGDSYTSFCTKQQNLKENYNKFCNFACAIDCSPNIQHKKSYCIAMYIQYCTYIFTNQTDFISYLLFAIGRRFGLAKHNIK